METVIVSRDSRVYSQCGKAIKGVYAPQPCKTTKEATSSKSIGLQYYTAVLWTCWRSLPLLSCMAAVHIPPLWLFRIVKIYSYSLPSNRWISLFTMRKSHKGGICTAAMQDNKGPYTAVLWTCWRSLPLLSCMAAVHIPPLWLFRIVTRHYS
jgi:hypothetical protein